LSGSPEYIWLDGSLVPASDAKVSVKAHSLHYGTAVFEGIRAYFGSGQLNVFRLSEHCERLVSSGRMLHLSLPFSAREVSEGVLEMLRKNGFRRNVYIRPIAFVGEGGINLDFRRHPKHVAIFAFPFDAYFERSGLRVCVSSWRRVSQSSMIPRAKAAGNYLNSCIATIEAKLAGYDEALLLDEEGKVSEGAGENLFIVNSRGLVTPPVYSAILEGITRQTVITIAKELGLDAEERPIDRSELYTAKEVFLTGTATEIESVLEIDGRKVSGGQPGAVTRKLRAAYADVVTGRSAKHASWLTPVYGSGRRRRRRKKSA
jgi:branched-chain amino acid aminotransferase